MSPEERQLVEGLFDRMRSNAFGQRDAEAEQMIADQVRQQPYAPYLLAQTVLVQDQALQAANAKLQQLQAQLQDQSRSQPSGGGGFLSGLFGGGAQPPAPAPRPVWNQGYSQPAGYPQGGYPPPPPQGGPWGGAPPMGGGGGGFMQGALQTAAGVAGGVMLADGIRSLFGGHNNPMGIASGLPGMGGSSAADTQQDLAQDSSFFGNSGGGATDADYQQDADQDQDEAQDASDFGADV